MKPVLRPSFSRRCVEQFLHQAAEFDFAQAQVAVVVADDFAESLQLAFGQRREQSLFSDAFDQTFGEHDDAVIRAFGFALDDGADDDVANLVHGDRPACGILPG